uniref:Uncharacterized protein n=1 Tax=Setaria italica TaxID=4555 RepID=K3XUE8_SETIT
MNWPNCTLEIETGAVVLTQSACIHLLLNNAHHYLMAPRNQAV